VLVHDLLCSKGGITAGTGPIKDAILRHKTRLKADFVKAELCANKTTSLAKRESYLDWMTVNNQHSFRDGSE